MLFLIDSGNLSDIERCVELFPVDGVTTNPTLVAKEKSDFKKLIKSIRDIIGHNRMLHVQTTAVKADDIVNEAKMLKDFLGREFYIKIPVCGEGLKATMACKKLGIKVTQTAIFTPQQALLAAKAGASFVAPYVNRLDNIVGDGVRVVADIVQIFKIHNLDAKVLAASFKSCEQVHKVALAGGHSVTVNPELFERLICHPLTDAAVDMFTRDWKSFYGEKTVEDFLR
jgi:fructose-6-phosphate aldolase 2